MGIKSLVYFKVLMRCGIYCSMVEDVVRRRASTVMGREYKSILVREERVCVIYRVTNICGDIHSLWLQ